MPDIGLLADEDFSGNDTVGRLPAIDSYHGLQVVQIYEVVLSAVFFGRWGTAGLLHGCSGVPEHIAHFVPDYLDHALRLIIIYLRYSIIKDNTFIEI